MTTQETARTVLSIILQTYTKQEEPHESAYARFCYAISLLDKLAGGYEPANKEEMLIMSEVAKHSAALQIKEDA